MAARKSPARKQAAKQSAPRRAAPPGPTWNTMVGEVEALVTAVSDLLATAPLGRPERAFITHGPANPMLCCNAVVAHVPRADLAWTANPELSGARSRDIHGTDRLRCGTQRRNIRILIGWYRPCWPRMPDAKASEEIVNEYVEASHQRAAELLQDLEIVQCGLPCLFTPKDGFLIEGLTPYGPAAGCVGWQLILTWNMRCERTAEGS